MKKFILLALCHLTLFQLAIAETYSNNQEIGSRGSNKLVARFFDQLPSAKKGPWVIEIIAGSNPEQILVRGANLVPTKSGLLGGSTSFGGLSQPSDFQTPAGYEQKTFSDGAVYYVAQTETPNDLEIGTRAGNKLVARYFDDFSDKLKGPWLVEVIKDQGPEKILIRGANLVSGKGDFLGGASGFGGLSQPDSFPGVPAGYTKKSFSDGAIYYQASRTSTSTDEDVGERDGNKLVARTFDGFSENLKGPWLVEIIKGSNPEQFLVRGTNLSGAKGTFLGGATGHSGMVQPSSFPGALSGYLKKTFPDGAVYYSKEGSSKPPLSGNGYSQGDIIGTRNGNTLIAVFFEDLPDGSKGPWVGEIVKDSNPQQILIRGTNLVSKTGFLGGNTGFGGLSEPSSFNVPTGYISKKFSDGAPYYVAADGSSITPVEIKATRPDDDSDDSSGTTGTSGTDYENDPIQTFNVEKFGVNKYYSPNFGFALDFNPGAKDLAQRRSVGINLFNMWGLTEKQKMGLTYGEGMLYMTESSFHGPIEGNQVFELSLAEYEAFVFDKLISAGFGNAAGIKLVVFNIETSMGWHKNNYTGTGHWPAWESVKRNKVTCETDGVVRTLEEIDNKNLWAAEEAVRRANRVFVLMKAIKNKGKPDVRVSWGASMYQGLPRIDFANGPGVFMEGSADVSRIGGTNGQINLNGRTYANMNGSPWDQEDVMWGYYYLFDFDIEKEQDYQDIFITKAAGKINYPYLWSKMKTRHIVADEKGYIQQNRRLMRLRNGSLRPIVRMMEPVFEGDRAGTVAGQGGVIARITWDELQPSVTGETEPPKIWQPPYFNYARYMVTRFFAGDEDGWGLYMFPIGPNHIGKELLLPFYKHHFHSISAFYQARAEMQPYETFWSGTTLVEDPEVQENQTGDFSSYDGTRAYNYDGGVQHQQRPSYLLRYKKVNDGWKVVIVGGMNQSFGTSRKDLVQVTGGGLNRNKFRVTLTGPSAQMFEFFVKSSESNQTIDPIVTIKGIQ